MPIPTPPSAYKIDNLSDTQLKLVKNSLGIYGNEVFPSVKTGINHAVSDVEMKDSFIYSVKNGGIIENNDNLVDVNNDYFVISVSESIPIDNIVDFEISGSTATVINFSSNGITETLELIDSEGNDRLRLDVENGIIKNKYYFEPTNPEAYFKDAYGRVFTSYTQSVEEILPLFVFYSKGSTGAENFDITIEDDGIGGNIGIAVSPVVGSDGRTTIEISIPSSMQGDNIIKIKENSNTLATLIIIDPT